MCHVLELQCLEITPGTEIRDWDSVASFFCLCFIWDVGWQANEIRMRPCMHIYRAAQEGGGQNEKIVYIVNRCTGSSNSYRRLVYVLAVKTWLTKLRAIAHFVLYITVDVWQETYCMGYNAPYWCELLHDIMPKIDLVLISGHLNGRTNHGCFVHSRGRVHSKWGVVFSTADLCSWSYGAF